MPSDAVIIVAAGSSQRFGEDKLMMLLQGRPLIAHTVEAFAMHACIEEVILVVAPGREVAFQSALQGVKISNAQKVNVVAGGRDRHESVQCGLRALAPSISWVGIHDGARPLISGAMIKQVFQKAREYGAAALAAPVVETLHRCSLNQLAETTVERHHLWAMQTPQVFRKEDLIGLLSSEGKQRPTDEVSALLQQGINTYLVENHEPNIKVTYPHDREILEAILSIRGQSA